MRAEAFTHRHFGQDKEEEISQLDYIIGPICDQYLFSRGYMKSHTSKSFNKEQKVDALEADNRRSTNVFYGRRSLKCAEEHRERGQQNTTPDESTE